jgi:fucose permease
VPLIAIAYLAFIGLGLPDPLPGTLWPEVRPGYGVAVSALGILLAATTCGSFAASMLAGQAARALGVGGVLALSVAATSVAALGQALAPPWTLFVGLALLGGLGAGAVDAVLNAFAARHFAVRHLHWLHASWGIGATLGPALTAGLLAAGMSWRAVLAAIGAVLGALALLFVATRRRWADSASAPRTQSASAIAVLRRPVAVLQVVVFLLYTGTEASAGQWAATVLTGARGATPQAAAATATLFWASLTVGRIALGLVVDRIGPDRLVRWATVVAVGAALLFAAGPTGTDQAALLLLGAALSPLYPTLMARTPARLGLAASMHAVGFQVASGTVGNALLPGLVGVVAERFGVAAAPPCIAVLAFALAVLVWRLPSSSTPPAAAGSRG